MYIYISYFERKQDLWMVHIHILLYVSEYIRFDDKWIFHMAEGLYMKQINCLSDFLFKRLQNRTKYVSYFWKLFPIYLCVFIWASGNFIQCKRKIRNILYIMKTGSEHFNLKCLTRIFLFKSIYTKKGKYLILKYFFVITMTPHWYRKR